MASYLAKIWADRYIFSGNNKISSAMAYLALCQNIFFASITNVKK